MDDLRSDLENLGQALKICQGNRIVWPDELPAEWSASHFEDKIVDMLNRRGIEGDVIFHCDEFPCIAQLPESTDWQEFRDFAKEEFGGPDVATVIAHSHGLVGEHGKRSLRFIAIGPSGYIDEFTQERIDDRFNTLVQDTRREMKHVAMEKE